MLCNEYPIAIEVYIRWSNANHYARYHNRPINYDDLTKFALQLIEANGLKPLQARKSHSRLLRNGRDIFISNMSKQSRSDMKGT